MRLRLAVLLAALGLPLALWAALPVGSSGAPSTGVLQHKIDKREAQIRSHRGREQVLTTDISADSRKIAGLQGDITRLQTRQVRLEGSLAAKRAQLAQVQVRLRQARERLARLRARLAEARVALAQRLRLEYESDSPGVLDVVLNAHGFADLLEREQFLHRVSAQDARIIGVVRTAKAQATAAATRLGALDRREAAVAAAIQSQADQVAAVKGQLVDRRDRWQSARDAKSRLLASTRDRRHKLESDVAGLRKQQSAIEARLAAASSASAVAGPIRHGSGALIWPVNGPITSPFCERRAWEACHPGIDIGVPQGTPIHAAAAGRVVLMQSTGESGGYGNYTCIQHSGPLETCYAHQSRFATSMGAEVRQGQVIGYTGCTGLCFGPHLHFETRINGQVQNPLGFL